MKDGVLSLDVEHLLGTHLIPINGREEIIRTVTLYRDMVQWIHDQSLRYINKGYTQAELKQQFQEVPEWFKNEPFSKEMYGTLEHIAPCRWLREPALIWRIAGIEQNTP